MVYSFSQMQLFLQCPRKYQYRYVDGIDTDFETTADLLFGQIVHKALEDFYKKLNIYSVWTQEQLITHFVNLRKQALEQAQRDHKEIVFKKDMTSEDYLRRGEHYLQRYYEMHAPFSSQMIVGTEVRFVFSLDEKKKCRGVIDRLDKNEDGFVIHDYKTNMSLPAQDKDQYTEQLTLYALGVQEKYGKYHPHIQATLHYLHFGMQDTWTITPELLERVTTKYRGVMEQIEHAKFSYNMGDTQAFPPVQNIGCKYCEYQSICPLWAHLKREDSVVGSELGETTIKSLVDEYVKLSKQEKKAEKNREVIKQILIQYARTNGLQKLFGHTARVSMSQQDNVRILEPDPLTVYLQEKGVLDQALALDRHKIMQLIKK